jgi:hypothetical protein
MSHEMTHTAENSPYADFALGNLGGCERPILPLKIVLRRGNKIKDLMKRPIDVCIQVETDYHNFLWGETNLAKEVCSGSLKAFSAVQSVRDCVSNGTKYPVGYGVFQIFISICCAQSALFSGPGKVYPQLVIIQGVGVEHADGPVGFALGAHHDKGKPSGFASFEIHDDIHRSDIPGLCKQSVQFLLCCIL